MYTKRYNILAILFVVSGLFLISPVHAQTTSIEEEAAGAVLEKIDNFRETEDPREVAKSMATENDPDREAVVQRTEELWLNEMQSLSDYIGENPEPGFEEFESVDTLSTVLTSHGFSVNVGLDNLDTDYGLSELETAFVGRFESPAGTEGPNLGVIVEYDALRGTDEAFHGCQHNAQGPIGFAAAIALSEYMEEESIPGEIFVYGTPAEEMGPPSKEIMLRNGVFEDVDFMVRTHGGSEVSRSRAGFGVCCLNINMVRYHFKGSPSHQRSSWEGRNALSAAVNFYNSVDAMRSSWRPEASIQGMIPEGGTAPNVVPDSAVVDYYIRYPDEVYLSHITDMMEEAARGSAQSTGTKVHIEEYGNYRDGISVSALEELYFAYAEEYEDPSDLSDELQSPSGFEETGFVSREIPGVSVSTASSDAPGHSYQRALDSMKPVGHEGFQAGAKIMSAIMYELLTNRSFRDLVVKEHEMLTDGFEGYLDNLEEQYRDEMNIQIE